MSERCMHYLGVACVDGSCPMTNYDSCKFCFYYRGCDDCAFAETDYCEDYQEGVKQDGKNKF